MKVVVVLGVVFVGGVCVGILLAHLTKPNEATRGQERYWWEPRKGYNPPPDPPHPRPKRAPVGPPRKREE